MCLAGGFYGNLNYTDSWRLPSQGRGMARHGLTSWVQKGRSLDSSGGEAATWPKVYGFGERGRHDHDTFICDENHLTS